jgi:hypothetical protein
MSFRTYIIGKSLLSFFVSAVLYSFTFLELLKCYTDLSIISFVFFILFSFILFKGGQSASKSKNKQLFSQFFLLATGIKMFLSLAIVLIYFLIVKPSSQYFIIPFFFVYICYTVFEVYFLTKLGNSKNN